MLRFESDDEDFTTRSVPTGRIEAAFQGQGFTFTDVVQETLICSVDSFDDVLDAGGSPYGASQEAVAVALNVFLNFKAGSGGSTDYVENVALNGDSLDFTAIGSAFGGSIDLSGFNENFANSDLTLDANRSHDFNGFGMLLNTPGFAGGNVQPAFFLDPLGTLTGNPLLGGKIGDLGGQNATILLTGGGGSGTQYQAALEASDGLGNQHILRVNEEGLQVIVEDGGQGQTLEVKKDFIQAIWEDATDENKIKLDASGVLIKNNVGDFFIDIPTADTVGKVLTLTNAVTKEVEFSDISTTGAILAPTVADESARDAAYPSPTNGQRVFNSRTQEIETYDSTFELWLSPTKKVAIRDTALLVDRFAYVSSFFTVSGVAYPVLSYPASGAQDNQTFGVIVEVGNSIDVARDFVAIAVANQQFVEFGEAIAVGEYVSAKLTAPNGGQGLAAGNAATTGRAGIAVQNSGATIGKPTKVLVQLNLLAESF